MTGQARETPLSKVFDRERLVRLADALAVALVVSLPWSTSATGILAGLWLIAVIPTLDIASVRREVFSLPGGLPVLLWLVGVVGMLWADVLWAERLHGLGSFHKLLIVPLLLAQFRRSGNGAWAIGAFLISCAALLALSWFLWFWPVVHLGTKDTAVPVKDRISQGAMFTVCILVLADIALEFWRSGRRRAATALMLLMLAFLLNIFFIANSRTALVAIPLLLVAFGAFRFGWKGAIGLPAVLRVLAGVVWVSSSHLQQRVLTLAEELRQYRSDAPPTPAGERVEYWKKSVSFIAAAPVIGHGTGSIEDQFRRAAGHTGVGAAVANNPHNQLLAVGIQLGLLGISVLFAMWLIHLLLFWEQGLAAWVGFVVVAQNIVGSMFNSHLFDFTHGWVYVVGVGIAGGVVLRRSPASPLPQEPL
jgi:O-antigen ligase